MIILMVSGIPDVYCNDNENIGEIHPLDVGGIDPPSIGWYYSQDINWSEHTITGVHVDGTYVGQTEHTWPYTSLIRDSDGVDTVFFQYRLNTNDEWMNRTPSLISGNSTDGQYSYTFVKKIWWDWESNRAEIEGGGFTMFRIFANDSLGNWRITMPTFEDVSLWTLNPPWQVVILQASPLIAAIGAICVLYVAVLIYRRKHVAAV